MKKLKKNGMAAEQTVLAVLALVLFVVIISTNMSLIKPLVAKLLGGTPINYDNSVTPAEIQDNNLQAKESINGLLYAINRLAYIDTEKSKKALVGEPLDENSLANLFGDTKKLKDNIEVDPALKGLETLKLTNLNVDKQIAQSIIDCWKVYLDNNKENSFCFQIDATGLNEKTFSSEDMYKSLENAQKDPSFKKQHDEIVDLLGKQGFLWGLFNRQNINWKGSFVIDKTTKPGSNVVICANKGGVVEKAEIFITNDPSNCNVAFKNGEKYLEMNVKNFALPQKISKGTDSTFFTTADAWLSVYGDPQYVLFYETFPKEEAAYWSPDAYRYSVTGIVVTEVIFALPLFKIVKFIASPLKSTVSALKASKGGLKTAVAAIRGIGGLKEIIKESAEKMYKGASVFYSAIKTMSIKKGYKVVEDSVWKELFTARAMAGIEETFGKDISKEVAEKSAKEIVDYMTLGRLNELTGKQYKRFFESGLAKDILDKVDNTALGDAMDKNLAGIGDGLWSGVANVKTLDDFARPLVNGAVKPRHIIALAVGIKTYMEIMEGRKYFPYGTNTVNLVQADGSVTTYDTEPGLESTNDNSRDDKIKEYFKQFGTEGATIGMLPETERYFLTLQRDTDTIMSLTDQDPQTFHLVSPCYASLRVRVTRCECDGYEDPSANLFWTGKDYQELYDLSGKKMVPNFDSLNYKGKTDEGTKTTFSYVDNGNYVKSCRPSKWYHFSSETTKPLCIEINPILDSSQDPNYCYHGTNAMYDTLKLGTRVAEIALPAIATGVCGVLTVGAGTVPCGLVFFAASTAFSIPAELMIANQDTKHMWPNHD